MIMKEFLKDSNDKNLNQDYQSQYLSDTEHYHLNKEKQIDHEDL